MEKHGSEIPLIIALKRTLRKKETHKPADKGREGGHPFYDKVTCASVISVMVVARIYLLS